MRKRRTMYHNDARHNYLWLFEPPISMDQAWTPVDEVAGTAVDTLSYCVARGDGAAGAPGAGTCPEFVSLKIK